MQRISLLDKSARLLRGSSTSGRQGGQSLVELAMILPMMLVLLVGIIEIGRFAYYSILVANAARAGAQYGAQGLATAADSTGIQAAAQNDGQNDARLTVSSVQQQCGCSAAILAGAAPGNSCPATCTPPDHALVYVQVTATGTFYSLFNYPGLPASITVTSTERMRVAQ